MSWRRQRVYKCDVCGREVPMHRNFAPGAPGFWRHAGNRHGFTICDECRDAIKWAKHAQEIIRAEQKQGQELQAVVPLERCGGLVGALQTMPYGGANDDKED